jgi:hypothetical protein
LVELTERSHGMAGAHGHRVCVAAPTGILVVRGRPNSGCDHERALRVALDDGAIEGPLSGALSSVLADLERQLALRAAS